MEAAEACRDAWESIRVSNQAALRARATRLSQAELTAAEAATEMLKGTGFNLVEVTRLFLLNPMNKPTHKITLASAGIEFRTFLSAEVKAKTMSSALEENLRIAQQSFTNFCGEKLHVHEVNGGQIEAWLRSKTGREGDQIKRKTWNNLRGDINRFFTWSMNKSRCWCTQNPVEDVVHFKKAELNRTEPERMDVSVCRELMAIASAGVPPDRQVFKEKWRIALELLDEIKPQLPAYQALVFDAGYGVILPLLGVLEKRGEPYVAQVPGNIAAWPKDARASVAQADRGRPTRHAKVQDPDMRALTTARSNTTSLISPRTPRLKSWCDWFTSAGPSSKTTNS